MLKYVILASLENEFTGYVGLSAIYLPQFTMQACVKAEFIAVVLKGDCIYLTSSWVFLSNDEIEDLKGNFRSLFFFLIFVFPNLNCWWKEGRRAVLCGWVSAMRGVCGCVSAWDITYSV